MSTHDSVHEEYCGNVQICGTDSAEERSEALYASALPGDPHTVIVETAGEGGGTSYNPKREVYARGEIVAGERQIAQGKPQPQASRELLEDAAAYRLKADEARAIQPDFDEMAAHCEADLPFRIQSALLKLDNSAKCVWLLGGNPQWRKELAAASPLPEGRCGGMCIPVSCLYSG